jgi:hypothetical protein
MLYLDYKAMLVNVHGKKIGYRLVPKLRPTKPSAAVFEELVKETGMNLPASSLESIFNSIVEATARLVEKDGWPRRIGNLKFAPTIKGVVESPYSEFDPETCEAVVAPSLLKGWERKIDPREVDIGNEKIGKRVRLMPTVGTTGERQWGRGDNLLLNGENIQLIEGDSVTVVWMDGEEEKSAALEVVSTKEFLTELKWPKELDGVAAGTKLELVWKSRGGIVDGVWQTRRRKLTLVEKEV